MMRMAGFFPSAPTQVNFELLYAPVNRQWRLMGLTVWLGQTEPVAPAPPAPPPVAEHPNARKPEAKAKASEDALKKARNQASAVATAGGRTLGDLLYASVDVSQASIIPVFAPQMAKMAAAPMATPPPTAEFTPQTVTINAHVNALFAIK